MVGLWAPLSPTKTTWINDINGRSPLDYIWDEIWVTYEYIYLSIYLSLCVWIINHLLSGARTSKLGEGRNRRVTYRRIQGIQGGTPGDGGFSSHS